MTSTFQSPSREEPSLESRDMDRHDDLSEELDSLFESLLDAGSLEGDSGRKLDGPVISRFREVLEVTTQFLEEIDGRLKPSHLQAGVYMSLDDLALFKKSIQPTLSRRENLSYIALREEYRLWLKEVGEVCLKEDGLAPAISPSSLDVPGYRSQEALRGCNLATFLMVFEGITGQQGIPENLFSDIIIDKFGHLVIDADIYSSFFTTQLFKDTYGVEVAPITITGATLGTIEKVAAGIRSKEPEVKVFCYMPILSEVMWSAWHSIVILGDDDEYVYCHDPGGTSPNPAKPIPKEEFYARWAGCLNIAHMFISRVL